MVDRLPSLRGIEAFACVSEVLNLRVASERLNITVSAVSHRIQGLEAELGVKLFDRGSTGLTLTREGRSFRLRLLPGLQALQEATRSAQPTASQKRVLRISAPPILHDLWLLPHLSRFTSAWPDTRIELLTTGRKRAAGTDIVIAPLSQTSIRDGAVPLFSFTATPMCSPEFAARHRVAEPADLTGLPLIDVSHSPPGWSVWFAAAGIDAEVPPPSILVDNQTLLYRAMINGLGLALGSRVLFAAMLEQGQAICPLECDVPIPPAVGLAVRNEERVTRAFADWLLAEAAETFGEVAS